MNPSLKNKFFIFSLFAVLLFPQLCLAKAEHKGDMQTFKLRVWQDVVPEAFINKDFKPAPPVNSAVVGQIKNVRQNLGPWNGVHHIIPGAHVE